VRCPSVGGSCAIGCTGTSTCGTGNLECGPGACLAQCPGLGSAVTETCGKSCACKKEGC
jgi:hypothetical protein